MCNAQGLFNVIGVFMKKLLLISLLGVLGSNVQVKGSENSEQASSLFDRIYGTFGSSLVPHISNQSTSSLSTESIQSTDGASSEPERSLSFSSNNSDLVISDSQDRFFDMMEQGSSGYQSYDGCNCSPLTLDEVKGNLAGMYSYVKAKFNASGFGGSDNNGNGNNASEAAQTKDVEIDATMPIKNGAEVATQTEKEAKVQAGLSDNQYAAIGVTCAVLAVYGSYKFAKWAYAKYQSSKQPAKQVSQKSQLKKPVRKVIFVNC